MSNYCIFRYYINFNYKNSNFYGFDTVSVANGVYQNTIFGMAAKLPGKYTGAVVLGSNISGTFTSVVGLLSSLMTSNIRMAAIYYFITALFILLVCFDTYFALPLNVSRKVGIISCSLMKDNYIIKVLTLKEFILFLVNFQGKSINYFSC